MAELLRILALGGGYNTTLVLLGAAALGAAAAIIGVFALLRRRALVSDAISHATLPGLALAFLVAVGLGLDGRSLPILLAGAFLSGAFGILAVQLVRDYTRLPEDAAIGTVLSVFYGVGIVLMSHLQSLKSASLAGLESFLLGATAGMLRAEALLIAGAAIVVAALALVFFRRFVLVCFDPGYAQSIGWSVPRIDVVMMTVLLAVVVIGLKTVGLILIIALLIIPPVAARFWTERAGAMVAIAAAMGAAAAYTGAAISATAPNLPTGALIVLCAAAMFVASLLLAPGRGLIASALRLLAFALEVRRRRALARLARGQDAGDRLTGFRLRRAGLLDGAGRLTGPGQKAAIRAVRDQALWQRYLDDFPEEAFGVTGFGARAIESVLPRDLVAELERRVAAARAIGREVSAS